MEKDDKGSTMIRMGVSGWMFLLVPAYPGCPRSKAVLKTDITSVIDANENKHTSRRYTIVFLFWWWNLWWFPTIAGLSSRVVSASDCGVRGPRFESRCWQLCLSRQLLRYTVLSTGCARAMPHLICRCVTVRSLYVRIVRLLLLLLLSIKLQSAERLVS